MEEGGGGFMDIKDKIEEIVEKVKTDKNFAANFKSDPVKAIESIIGIDLPDDVMKNAPEAETVKE